MSAAQCIDSVASLFDKSSNPKMVILIPYFRRKGIYNLGKCYFRKSKAWSFRELLDQLTANQKAKTYRANFNRFTKWNFVPYYEQFGCTCTEKYSKDVEEAFLFNRDICWVWTPCDMVHIIWYCPYLDR